MIGSKRKSEDVHASTGKKERAASGEPAKLEEEKEAKQHNKYQVLLRTRRRMLLLLQK